ncbi:MAG: Ig-like domain-containing protein, partial [Paludibacteraceae bacterium]|nr:Ig-like domain-containing protein [Paludibacteraceae bacterium]
SSSVTWTSSNPSVATVDANGKITAVSAGTFTVTATSTVDGSVSGTSATVTVTAPMAQVCNNSFGIAQIEDESPLIDNLIEDVWATTPKNAINQVLNGGGNPSNAGNWRALYDGDNLYLLVEVSDPSKQGNAGWNGDAVEIYIDGNGNGGNNSYADADDAAIKFSFSGNSVGSTGMAYSGNKYSSFKMYDTPNGYTLEVAVPWSNIGGFPSNNRNMKVAVLVNQADAGGNRHSIVGSNASNTDVYQYVGNIQNNATFCRTTDLTLSGNNEVMSCMGDLITMTVDGLPAGATPVWQVYDAGISSWVTDENAKLIDGKWILMADNKKHRVIYNAMKSNVYKLPAATCCSSEVGSYVLWNQDFGTLGSNCARKDFDPSWNVHVSGGMQYNTGAIDDGYYAIVANPGCGEFGNNNGLPWFYDGEDHTAGDTNGGMLLVNNGARESVVFSQYVPSPCDNATVDFSAWFANVCKTQGDCGQPVNLTFKVSGKRDDGVWEDIDISNMSTGDIPWKNSLQWEKKNTSFNTSSYSELYIQVINEGTSGQGNDVAIDDFEFVSCAPVLNLYADVSTYGKTAVACEDKVVTLVPKAPMDLQELYQPLFYMLQRFDPTQNKWVAASGISTPGNNPLPSWDINTADLSFGTHRYRVVMGNNEETVRTVADGGNPTVENCILYTVTDEATIEKSTLDLVADQAITRCEGSSVVLEPENNDSESVSWNWKSGSTVICSGTNDNAAGCDNLQTVVVGSAVSNYTYTATDAYGCTQTTNFTITPSSPKYHFSQDREICEGESAVLKMDFVDSEAPYTFVFSDGTNNENITTSSNPWTRTVTPASTTTYSVRSVRDKNCGMQEDN